MLINKLINYEAYMNSPLIFQFKVKFKLVFSLSYVHEDYYVRNNEKRENGATRDADAVSISKHKPAET